MRLPYFHYYSPKSLNSLFGIQEKVEGRAVIMAGGTELLNRMRFRLIEPEYVISLSNIKGLDRISISRDKGIEIGATAKLTDIACFFEAIKPYRAIYESAYQVASQQIRNMATIGGNILQDTRCMFYNRSRQWQGIVPPCHKRGGNTCHAVRNSRRCFAVYQGDMAPVLISLKAIAVFHSPYGDQEIPLEDVFSGDSKKPFFVEDNRILVSVRINPSDDDLSSIYKKYRIRDGVDFPLAGVALSLKRDRHIISHLRLCLTGLAPRPIRVSDAEEIAQGERLTGHLIEKISEIAFNSVHPVDNLEESAKRRRFMARQMVYDVLEEAARAL